MHIQILYTMKGTWEIMGGASWTVQCGWSPERTCAMPQDHGSGKVFLRWNSKGSGLHANADHMDRKCPLIDVSSLEPTPLQILLLRSANLPPCSAVRNSPASLLNCMQQLSSRVLKFLPQVSAFLCLSVCFLFVFPSSLSHPSQVRLATGPQNSKVISCFLEPCWA